MLGVATAATATGLYGDRAEAARQDARLKTSIKKGLKWVG
jgi:hypothetical protein